MSIGGALKASVSGLQAAEEQITIASGNIANAGTPGYVRQRAILGAQVTNGRVTGVSVLGISAEINESLAAEIRSQSADLAQQDTLTEYYQRITALYGSPGKSNGVSDRVNDFFATAQKLSDNPEELALRRSLVDDGADLARSLSGAAQSLQDLRFQADKALGESFVNVNNLLTNLHDFNTKIVNFKPQEPSYENLLVEQDKAVRELSEYFPVTQSRASDGSLSLTGPGGSVLLDRQQYRISYKSLLSADSLLEGENFSAAKVSAVNASGAPDRSTPTTIITGGQKGTSLIERGKIRALLDLRDQILPELNAQLDSLTDGVRETINAAHNDGSSFPPAGALKGQRMLKADSKLEFSGQVRVAALQPDGLPIDSPYGDQERVTPLTLDLGALDGGEGPGKFTTKQVIDEINDYFAPRNMTTVGNLRDVRLKLKDDAVADAGSASFTLEYENLSALGASVKIKNVAVVDPADSTSAYPAVTVPSASFSVGAGERKEDSGRFTLDFSGDDNRASYTVNVTVEVTDDDGNVSESVLSYTVADDKTGVRNTRVAADSVSVTSGTGTWETAPTVSTPLRAVLRDAGGNVAAEGEEGTLRIEGRGTSYRVAVAELDSAYRSDVSQNKDIGKGFSHFFGLNNFFSDPGSAPGGAARNFKVRDDLQSNPGLLTVGALSLSPQPSDPSKAAYTYELGAANNAGVRGMAAAGSAGVAFAATAALSAGSATFAGYSASLTEYVSSLSANATTNRDLEQYAFDQLQQENLKETGVDADAELAKVLELESQYSAAATLIGTLRSMLQVLAQAFG